VGVGPHDKLKKERPKVARYRSWGWGPTTD
jgi:hypothetical protein